MTRIAQSQVGSIQWFSALLALGLFGVANFQPAFNATAIWLAGAHGHDHEVVARADGNSLDVVLSHHDDQEATEHDQEQSVGLVAGLFSTPAHEGDDHVLHFSNGDAQSQINSRNAISPAPPQQWVLPAAALTDAGPAWAKAAPAFVARPPPLVAGLICLRTTVLLI